MRSMIWHAVVCKCLVTDYFYASNVWIWVPDILISVIRTQRLFLECSRTFLSDHRYNLLISILVVLSGNITFMKLTDNFPILGYIKSADQLRFVVPSNHSQMGVRCWCISAICSDYLSIRIKEMYLSSFPSTYQV